MQHYIEDAAVFDAETVKVISTAFDQVCGALHLDGDSRAREVVAVRIIELARSGVVDIVALRERLLREGGARL